MTAKNIALALAAIMVVGTPVAANADIGRTTKGVKHWVPPVSQRSRPWFQKWLEKERKQGREYNFDSQG